MLVFQTYQYFTFSGDFVMDKGFSRGKEWAGDGHPKAIEEEKLFGD